MKGKVGPFFYKDGKILADAVDIASAEKYGEFRTWGNHAIYWDSLSKTHPEFRNIEYIRCLRGRITYNFNLNKFYIYLNPKLNNIRILRMILHEFDLNELDYIVDDTDEHYQL